MKICLLMRISAKIAGQNMKYFIRQKKMKEPLFALRAIRKHIEKLCLRQILSTHLLFQLQCQQVLALADAKAECAG